MSTKPMRIQSVIGLGALLVAAAATASCGDVVRSGQSPVLLNVNSVSSADGNSVLVSDVISEGSVSNDVASATLSVVMKDVTVGPTTNNRVTISRYRVVYYRADGRNAPGVDVPFSFDGAATVTIDAGSSGLVSFEIVRHIAKVESPLVQLLSERRVINAIAEVTFFGQDQVGNDVSAKGNIQVDFLNLADSGSAPAPEPEDPAAP
jgi:hypothetical protein